MTTTERPCAFPPHPDGAGHEPHEPAARPPAPSRFRGWLAHAPAERVPLPAIPSVWTAAEILHAAGVGAVYPGAATALAVLGGGWLGERRARDPARARLRGAELAAATGACGAWLTAATAWGPLAGPDHLMSLAYAAGAGGGYWWLRRHEAVRAARARRDEAAAWTARKSGWHRLAPLLGLRGSHLLEHDDTLLGDTMLIDVRGTGRRASSINARDVAERLGELEMIPVGRIDVTTDRIPGRLRITRRTKDPWKHALTHPAVDPDSPYARYAGFPATCRKPLVIGADPETGEPFALPVWDEDEGAKVILIAAKKGSGKSVLLSCIKERLTACPDARLIQVNLSKAREDRWWAPLALVNALGMDTGQRRKARAILRWAYAEIVSRSEDPALAASKVAPTPARPLLTVTIDEVDVVAKDPECKALLADIASKCRSEGIALIIAGQRATVQWIGGADLRALVDIVVLGRFARPGEARLATGGEIDLPDMGAYGEGAPGVFLVTELGGGGGYDRGRVFKLSEADDVNAIVARRLAGRRPYVPGAGRAAELWAQIDGDAGPPGGQDGEDQDLEDDVTAGGGPAGRIAAARELAGLPARAPEVDPAVLAASIAARRAQFDAQYAEDMPGNLGAALREMLAAPGGISTRKAAEALGCSHMTVSRQLHKWKAEGLAEVRGRASGRRWHLTGPGAARQAMPDPGDGPADQESEVIEVDAEQVHGPGQIGTEQVVMMVAFWALQHGARYAAAVSRDMGMPDAAVARALRLAEDDPAYVKDGARRALLEAGAPVPGWLAEDGPGDAAGNAS
jgi:Homeodomain-like domain